MFKAPAAALDRNQPQLEEAHVNSRSSTTRHRKYAAAIILALVMLAGLLGCTKTVTVTYKYRSAIGWYWVCTGPSFAPCIKGNIWHVSKARYDQARIGQPYTIHIG